MYDWFFERLQSFGEDKALVYPTASGERVASYRDLIDAAARFRGELATRGIGPSEVVAVEGAFTLNATALILALIEARAVVVPLVREMRAQRDACLEVAEASWLFEFDDEDGFSAQNLGPVERSNQTLEKLRKRSSPGLVIFSSGSTGQPKGILHDFAQILKKFEKVRQKKVTLCFLLFDHIGGVDTLLSTLTSGGTLVTVARRDPATVVEAIERHQVHTLPTSPTFLNLLLISGLVEKHDLRSLRVIAYGTEPMPAGTLARLHAAFPEAALVQTYGMSELGVLRSRSKDSSSPWIEFSQDGFQVDVRDGLLWVKAETAMLGYLNAPDFFDQDGWLNTQDAVEVDGPYFRILGRKTDLINVGGQKVYPTEVEGCLLEMPNVRDVSVFGKPNPMTGQMVAARFNLIEPEPLAEFKVRMFAFCRSHLAAYQIPRAVEIVTEDQFGARFKKSRREH